MFNEMVWVYWSPVASAWLHSDIGGQGGTLAVVASAAVLLALLIDRLCGEPPVWLHPVVMMGKLLNCCGQKIAPSQEQSGDYKSFVLGALAWCALAAVFFIAGVYIQAVVAQLTAWMQAVLMGVLLKPLLSWRMLKSEVQAVDAALQISLEQGRERLSWLVSRDTSQLDAGVVRESAIETLAENLSDSVIAPLFWFVLLGLPGAMVYRFANTADAMWGYPGWRGHEQGRRHWQWAGKWAARVDDVLNWVPARITAVLLAGVGSGVRWRALYSDASVTPSPNGGWPMGAMAQLLNVRLGKPGVYVLNKRGEIPQKQHVQKAICLASRVVLVLMLWALSALCIQVGLIYG